ncbi:MAG: phospholipid/cholesterol/gamma-HCH transport system substrate-binding protein [Solirubrobacteraceae bacterium]|jgi:virulence factor Mce-like protein|nr:phospholipid/cholesterol/gamma-HCH transport system substrate-binding protein [Solirubrobacteraceae bacterium]
MAHKKSGRLVLEVRRSFKPFLLLLGLSAAGILVFATIFHNLTFPRPWINYREVKAEFADVKGIFPKGHQVRIHGVNVGVVKKAELVDGRAILTLSLQEKYGPIYKNAKLQIRPVTPLEDLYVNVTDRGTPSAGEAKGNYVIQAGQTITPVDVSRILDTFDEDTRLRMATLLTELGKGLGPEGGQRLRESFATIAPFLHVAERATKVMAERRQNLGRLINNFGGVSAALAQRDRQLHTLVEAGDVSLGELAANDRAFGDTFTSIARLMPVMRSSFASVRTLSDNLDPALESLKPVAANLQSGLEGLRKFGLEATPAFQRLRPAIASLRTMATQVAPTSVSLRTAFQQLNQRAPAIDTITKVTVPCDKIIPQFFSHTLSVLKFGDANGAFPRAETTGGSETVGGLGVPVNFRLNPTCIGAHPGY